MTRTKLYFKAHHSQQDQVVAVLCKPEPFGNYSMTRRQYNHALARLNATTGSSLDHCGADAHSPERPIITVWNHPAECRQPDDFYTIL